MRANELMLGDWVSHFDEGKNCVVTELHERKVSVSFTDSNGKKKYSEPLPEMAFEPIQLTAEILEKNGFDVSDKEVMQYHFEEDGEKYHFSLRQMYDKDGTPHGYSFYVFNVLTLIDYVHQLQHALRLCNIDKEIEL